MLVTYISNPVLQEVTETVEDVLVLAWKANNMNCVKLAIDSLNHLNSEIAEKRGTRTYVMAKGLLRILK